MPRMIARLRSILIASTLLGVSACGGTVVANADAGSSSGAGGADGFPCTVTPPGLCPPTPGCIDGFVHTGQSTCVNGLWVCGVEPCDGGAGGGCASVHVNNYVTTCAGDADCVAVYDGSLCSNCRCPNATIAASSQQAYDADVKAGSPAPQTCDCSLVPTPLCQAGKCTLP